MLVVRGTPRLLSFLATITGVVLLCYFVLLAEVANRHTSSREKSEGEHKKIVAFSLLKQIELESEEFHCDEELRVEGEPGKQTQNETAKLWTKLEGSDLFIYSVYLDARLYPYNYVRIIAMVKGIWNDTLFCQILSSNNRYHITKAIPTKIWSKTWNRNDSHVYYNPFLISCHLPLNATFVYLSLSKNPCQIGHQKIKIPISSQVPKNFEHSFTICVKSLNFNKDISDHLLQWITINQILGANKIEFYVEHLSKKTLQFLENFEKINRGVLNVHRHKIIRDEVGLNEATYIWQKRRYEIITYNDCLYRNIHKSHFVIPVDIDEIIVPRHVTTWAELLHKTLTGDEDNFASYTVRNAYYLRQFNAKRQKEKIFFLRDLIRSDFSEEGESGKSFVSTKNALTVFNHYALKSLKQGIRRNVFLKSELVQMNHYKNDCDIVILPECAKYISSPVRIVDVVVSKYKKVFYRQYALSKQMLNLSITKSGA